MDGVLIQKDRYITVVALRKDDLVEEHNCNTQLIS